MRKDKRIAARAAAVGIALLAACSGDSPAEPVCDAPERLGQLPDALRESSGVAASRAHDVVWSHNDSQRGPELFAVDLEARLVQRLTVTGADNRDWEDIALGPCPAGRCLYIADIGDNRERRDDIAVYRVPEPDPADTATAAAERFPVRYPDRPQDAESIFVLASGAVYIVTKGRSGAVALYRYPAPLRPDEPVTLERVQTLTDQPPTLSNQVTGAAAAPESGRVVLRTYAALRFYRLLDGRLSPAADAGDVDLRPLAEPQGEGVDVRADGTIILTSEAGPVGAAGPLSRVHCRW